VGMERVAVLIGRCATYEWLYLTGHVPKNAEGLLKISAGGYLHYA